MGDQSRRPAPLLELSHKHLEQRKAANGQIGRKGNETGAITTAREWAPEESRPLSGPALSPPLHSLARSWLAGDTIGVSLFNFKCALCEISSDKHRRQTTARLFSSTSQRDHSKTVLFNLEKGLWAAYGRITKAERRSGVLPHSFQKQTHLI